MTTDPTTGSDEPTLEISAGLLVRRKIRNELERLKFIGHDISWHEARCGLSSEFTIKGPDAILLALHEAIDSFNEAVARRSIGVFRKNPT